MAKKTPKNAHGETKAWMLPPGTFFTFVGRHGVDVDDLHLRTLSGFVRVASNFTRYGQPYWGTWTLHEREDGLSVVVIPASRVLAGKFGKWRRTPRPVPQTKRK